MSGKNITFHDKKIKKVNFTKTRNYLLKKRHIVKKAHLNTSLGIMMMVLLDHYV